MNLSVGCLASPLTAWPAALFDHVGAMLTGLKPATGIRVAVIEKHALFADLLSFVLSREGYEALRIPVPESPNPCDRLITVTVRTRPHLVLLEPDLGMVGDGCRIIEPITVAGAAVIVVTASNDRARWGEAIECGAHTVLSKSRPLAEIMTVLRRFAASQPILGPDDREEWLRAWHAKRSETIEIESRLAQLTHREAAVLSDLMRGQTVHDIARANVLAEATIRTQIKAIFTKLGVTSQLTAVAMAHKARWRAP